MKRFGRYIRSIAVCIVWEGQHDGRASGPCIQGMQGYDCQRCGRSFVR